MKAPKQKKQKTGFARLLSAFFYSRDGLRAAWIQETAFRQELLLGLCLTPFIFWMGGSLVIKLILLGSIFVVLITELMNSAIEAVVDMITEDFHPLAKKAKDMASAAVLLSLICGGVIWTIVLVDTLFPTFTLL